MVQNDPGRGREEEKKERREMEERRDRTERVQKRFANSHDNYQASHSWNFYDLGSSQHCHDGN